MLTHIQIKQFAIVEQLELDIPTQFCVITGETGAGKSILLDALGLALGDRADSSMVRHGADTADIHCCFDIANHDTAKAWLAERDLSADDECILRRVIQRDGRSKSYINGTPSTLSATRELGELLVSIHGQHEHQALLKRDAHRTLLDEYGHLQGLATEVARHFQTWQQRQKLFENRRDNARELQDRADLIRFQLQEFDLLDLQEGEYPQLEQEHKRLANVDSLLSEGHKALDWLTEQDNSLNEQLQGAQHCLEGLCRQDSALQETLDLIDTARIQVEEAGANLQHYLDNLETDPDRFQWVDQRLSSAFQLARKHRIDPYELYAHHQQLRAELDSLASDDDALDRLAQDAESAKQAYLSSAEALSVSRRQQAEKLSKVVTRELKTLGMPAAQFAVSLQELDTGQYGAHGLEQVEFQVTANAGQPLKPLSKVASGGELSRISLCIQVACAHRSQVATLVFDEVDVGIGGGTAQVVGRLLRTLGENNQILCVTHQPQVAAQGHHHLHVNKSTRANQTHTRIQALSTDEKVLEVARMLGGVKITEQSVAHARELMGET